MKASPQFKIDCVRRYPEKGDLGMTILDMIGKTRLIRSTMIRG